MNLKSNLFGDAVTARGHAKVVIDTPIEHQDLRAQGSIAIV